MDEPFGSLDEFTRERLNFELLRLIDVTQKTVVFVTHNITEAVLLADRVLVMAGGPGRIISTVDVPLPRPRTQATMRRSEFSEIVFRIRGLLGLEEA
jgi:NitT/TauT family transport system ATP-binding protein